MSVVMRARLAPRASRGLSDLWHRTRGRVSWRRTGKALCSAATPVELDGVTAVEGPSFNAFLDFKFVQENLDLVRENCRKRKAQADPDAVARLYSEYIAQKLKSEELRAARNENGKAMKGELTPDERQKLIERGSQLKAQISAVEAELESLQNQLQSEGQRLPNLTHPGAPVGDEDCAVVLKTVGEKRDFHFEARDHISLGEELDLVDFANAALVTGSKFYYLKNEAARMEMALLNWAFQSVVEKGFTPIMTPDLIRESVLEKCGFQPRAQNTQVYSIEDSDLALAGTAEVPLAGLFMDQTLDEAELPIRLVAFGHCFRTEAGSPGAASKGLYRVHQFSKIEMFVISTPRQSEFLLAELTAIEEDLYTQLGLHFKILDMPTADLGAPAYRKHDIEAWMPGLQRYGEISSASNCTDYQSRRLNIRYRPKLRGSSKKAQNVFVHTLNATACAVPRMIVSILENYQNADGTVSIPQVLQPYLGGMAHISKLQKKEEMKSQSTS